MFDCSVVKNFTRPRHTPFDFFFSFLKKCTITQELLQLSIDVVQNPIQFLFKKKKKKLACSLKGYDSCSHGFL